MDENLRSPGAVILTHTHLSFSASCMAKHLWLSNLSSFPTMGIPKPTVPGLEPEVT